MLFSLLPPLLVHTPAQLGRILLVQLPPGVLATAAAWALLEETERARWRGGRPCGGEPACMSRGGGRAPLQRARGAGAQQRRRKPTALM